MIAAYAGSFDPVTNGHINMIEKAASIFEEVVVILGVNSAKKSRFSTARRLKWLQQSLAHLHNVRIVCTDGLTVQAAAENKAGVLVRGLRNAQDAAYEQSLAWINARLGIETIQMFCDPQWSLLSSSVVRELLDYGQSIEGLVPDCVYETLQPELAGKESV